MFVDASSACIDKLKTKFGHLPNVSYLTTKVNIDNINNIVPKNTLFISIDTDGNDYWLWEALKINPLFMVIEFNLAFPPPQQKVMRYNENHSWD